MFLKGDPIKKTKCYNCQYCQKINPHGRNKRAHYYCEHPNQEHILEYFRRKKINKAPGYLGTGRGPYNVNPVKTAPAWCPENTKTE